MNTPQKPPRARAAKSTITRRSFLHAAGTLAGAAALGGTSAACNRKGSQSLKTIKIGYVSPQTGELALFADADNFVIGEVNKQLQQGVAVQGKTHPAQIIVKDSQSNPNRAAEVATELILSDEVDIVLVASTPETTNPVADQCEVNGVPCISTVAPWQPWFFTRGGKPETGFEWTYHFFWGLEDIIAVYTGMWEQLETNKIVGGLFPNDGDGNAWGDPERGLPPDLKKKSFQLIDPGRHQNLTDDFSSQISAFKTGNAEIITGVVIPPDWTTFWIQANQQGFKPKAASIGKALLFPAAVEALGDAGHNLSTEVWWSPHHPFRSSLTQQSSKELASAYTQATKKQWTQPLGFVHALFEVAVDVLRRTEDVSDRKAVLSALQGTKAETIVGPVAWGNGPVKNVAKTPLVGGQWRRGGDFAYDMVITFNGSAPNIPTQGKMEPLG